MDFPDPSPLKKAVDDLIDIVNRSQGENHEVSKLVRQIEAIVQEIEIKTGGVALTLGQDLTQTTSDAQTPAQAQTTIVPPPIPTIPVV